MKKLLLSTLLIISVMFITNAQTQRMVMYEGFSNASCGPCASQNPAIQAVIDANLTKVVAIKYQVNWPGSDPMNAQTQADVNPKVLYYGITGVPATRVDGTAISMNQTNVNNRYAVPSPFFLNLTHELSPTGDSMYVKAVVRAAQAFNGNNLVLQVGMVEREINFASPAGSNGEKNFFNVMRKMVPNSSGTPLQSAWNLNDSVVIELAVKIPTYIYDISRVAFVAFVQQNSDKAVLQAAKTNPLPIDNYAIISSNNIPVEPACMDSVQIEIGVTNKGSVDITTFDVEYGIVGQTPSVYSWTGAIAADQTLNISLPFIQLIGSSPAVYAKLLNTNGVTGTPTTNTQIQGVIPIISSYTSAPINQTFAATAFPPANWHRVSADNVQWTRATVGGFGLTPGGSAKMDFFNSPQGEIDYLYVEGLDLSNISDPTLTFSLAHATYSASYNDRLAIEVSTNCGQNWSTIYNKSSASGLTTAPYATNTFTPTASQWVKETVSLTSVQGQSEVLIRFKATSGYGNNLYIDDVQVLSTTSVNDVQNSLNYVNIFPNPVEDMLNIDFFLNKESNVNVKVYDITGKLVASNDLSLLSVGKHQIKFDSSNWTSGMYFTVVSTDNGVITNKVIKH